MTEITWTNCADKMPPDGWARIIFRDSNSAKPIVLYAHSVYDFKNNNTLKPSAEWTPHTPEKWKELNK